MSVSAILAVGAVGVVLIACAAVAALRLITSSKEASIEVLKHLPTTLTVETDGDDGDW